MRLTDCPLVGETVDYAGDATAKRKRFPNAAAGVWFPTHGNRQLGTPIK